MDAVVQPVDALLRLFLGLIDLGLLDRGSAGIAKPFEVGGKRFINRSKFL